jgi:hypothetical protein
VARAPHILLGVEPDANTKVIIHSFHDLARKQQQNNLRLNKLGRRLEAAKKEMLARRRQRAKFAKTSY